MGLEHGQVMVADGLRGERMSVTSIEGLGRGRACLLMWRLVAWILIQIINSYNYLRVTLCIE
jgi:hypothetical protein